MEGQNLWYLENIDVAGLLSPDKLEEIMKGQLRKDISKGEYIYLPDQHADKLYFISEGKVKIGSISENGKEITKALLGKGEVFGELSMVGDGKRPRLCLCHGRCYNFCSSCW